MRLFRWLRANILYGAAALIPVAALLLIAWYLYDFWQSVLTPVTNLFGLETFDTQATAVGLALGALLVTCLLMGMIVRSRIGGWTFDRIEERVLSNVPGYGMISTLLRGFAEQQNAYPAALARLGTGAAQVPCFVMEDTGGETLTIFVPSAPVMTVGTIYIVPRDDVEVLSGVGGETANALSQWGVGAQAAIAAARNIEPVPPVPDDPPPPVI
ncbi:MAG: hypothetical protein AAFZ01_01295 [Pseudomonadota bacterium]